MDCRGRSYEFQLGAYEIASGSRHELRIYRADGHLSVTYFTACGNDADAISEATKIARYGYQVEIWQAGIRIDPISSS